MSYCPNPHCLSPQNTLADDVCQACGAAIVLHQRYRAIKLLGQGEFGRTFLGVDVAQSSQPRCVIKQCLPRSLHGRTGKKVVELFQREIHHLKTLGHHAQIPGLLDCFQQEGWAYLVQVYVPGQTLAGCLEKEGTFGEDQIRQLLEALLPVVQFVHDRQVIHRDIKPKNLIRRREDRQVVLVDFGISKAARGVDLAATGTAIGSAGYAAPEQVVGRATFASDLYSLGVTCLYLLTGISPVDLFSFGEGRWVWRDFLRQPLGDTLAAILDRLVERDLNYRYSSAAAVLQDLDPSRVVQPERSPEFFQSFQVRVSRTGWHCAQTLCGHRGAVLAIAPHPSGHYFASAGVDQVIQLWSITSRQVVATFTGHTEAITSLVFSPDGRWLISGSVDDTIRIWDVVQRQMVRMICDHSDSVVSLAVALCPYGQVIASGSDDHTVRLWHFHDGSLIRSFQENRAVTDVEFSPDGCFLATSSSDDTIKLWNLSTGEVVRVLSGHQRDVNSFVVTNQGEQVVSGSSDNTLCIWNFKTRTRRRLTGHLDWVKSVALHPNQHLVASGSADHTVRLWSLSEGKRIATLTGHTRDVNAVAFVPKSSLLLSGSGDRTVKLWWRSPHERPVVEADDALKNMD